MRYFCEGTYFLRIEFSLIRKRADGSEKYGLGGFEMRKLKRVNVPNIPEQQSQPSHNRSINKKKLRRLILMVLFIAATTLYVQYILTKQQEIIINKKDTITNQKKQLVSLKKDQLSLKTNIENLTDNEEEILKFARKEYQFSKSNETIFVLPK